MKARKWAHTPFIQKQKYLAGTPNYQGILLEEEKNDTTYFEFYYMFL